MEAPGTPSVAAVSANDERQPVDTVSFTQQHRTDYRNNRACLEAQYRVRQTRFAWACLGAFLLWMPAHFLVGSKIAFDLLFLVLCLILVIFTYWQVIAHGRLGRNGGLPQSLPVSQASRLCCIGKPEALAQFGEWADVPFEPALFFGRFVIRGRGPLSWAYAGITAATALVLLVPSLYRHGVFEACQNGLIGVGVGLGVAEILTALLWPTYLRLVPGRLDVLGYTPFSRKPNFYHGYNLRDAEITVDLRHSFVTIASPRGKLEFGIALMRERRYFAYMLFLAAMSTHQPGPVPEDELVG